MARGTHVLRTFLKRYLFVICFLCTSGQMFFSQTPSRRPPHFTGRRVNTVSLGWL